MRLVHALKGETVFLNIITMHIGTPWPHPHLFGLIKSHFICNSELQVDQSLNRLFTFFFIQFKFTAFDA